MKKLATAATAAMLIIAAGTANAQSAASAASSAAWDGASTFSNHSPSPAAVGDSSRSNIGYCWVINPTNEETSEWKWRCSGDDEEGEKRDSPPPNYYNQFH